MQHDRNKLNNQQNEDSENQLLKPRAEQYLRDAANIEDLPDAEDTADAEETEKNENRDSSEEK